MTEMELKEFIKKARRINFHPGSHLFEDAPGQIYLLFEKQDVLDYLEFSKHINKELKDFKITAYINQVAIDKVDFTLIIEKEPAIILSVKGLPCIPDKIDYFFKKLD